MNEVFGIVNDDGSGNLSWSIEVYGTSSHVRDQNASLEGCAVGVWGEIGGSVDGEGGSRSTAAAALGCKESIISQGPSQLTGRPCVYIPNQQVPNQLMRATASTAKEKCVERIDLPATVPMTASAGRRSFWENMVMELWC